LIAFVVSSFVVRKSRPPQINGASLANINSIAVLPFQQTGDPNEKYLANAVPMEITSSLAQVDQFRTVPWTFVKELADKSKSLNDLVAATDADGVVEGSVQLVPSLDPTSPRRVRITVQLYAARTGSLMWSHSFEDEIGHFIGMNARIADDIVQQIRNKLQIRREVQLTTFQRIEPEAMELYLRSRDLRLANQSSQQLRQAIDYLALAIEKDGKFPQPYNEAAECYLLLAGYWHVLSPQQAYPRVMDLASRAMTLDESLAGSWATRAYARYILAWDWNGAEADFNRALTLRVDTDQTHVWHAEYLTAAGRHKEAIAELEELLTKMPQSWHLHRQAAWSYFFARDYDAAIDHLEEALRLDKTYIPAQSLLGRAYVQKGLYDKGIAELESVAAGPSGANFKYMVAYAYAAAGHGREAENSLKEYLAVVPLERSEYEVALVETALGHSGRALDLLESACLRKDTSLVNLKTDPRLDRLRSMRRFTALLQRVGFPS
jgi:TolB-like protein/tetratricopeptide (TPR) repeat protein